ncbi:MAG: aspartate dehydrogenase [Clostridium sp.]|nr:aspartate dehydrogenase [Acetatifactor muris]MCM1528071.1 hypothetical protein [Bacteroides sp.]MCM1564283.1 aspartate dehydrogenase [Clostridium sp.]
MFGKKKSQKTFDRDNLQPLIRASICTGEQVAGFKEIRTGKFVEDMLIRNEKDRAVFMEKYGLSDEDIKREW